jgi:ferritin-like metal-binding protein YciE
MASPSMINREWIAAEFSKGVDAERSLAAAAKERADAPPDPAMSVLFHEIAAADERHGKAVETIAIRYGYTPSRSSMAGSLGETLGRIKDKVAESVVGSSPLEILGHDLVAKANAVHWYTAWIHAFEAIGDTESARELAAILTEEKSHQAALQDGLNRSVERGARGEAAPSK